MTWTSAPMRGVFQLFQLARVAMLIFIDLNHDAGFFHAVLGDSEDDALLVNISDGMENSLASAVDVYSSIVYKGSGNVLGTWLMSHGWASARVALKRLAGST
mmetsp:Transcript_27027/g.68752  ORF Transcript_27027/g.68752 Transcript_27027/m.68752 type:complete len:102 (-) Transcript_27027:780-1085(-)